MDYKKLQNGSDIRGIALPGASDAPPDLTEPECEALTLAFIDWLSQKTGKHVNNLTVSVGRDSRLTGPSLARTAACAMISRGVKVLDCGIASTPAMFMSTVFPEYDCDGAIMVTASHLPYDRNGFKYFSKCGGLNNEDISQIILYAEADSALDPSVNPKDREAVIEADLMSVYCNFLKDKIKNEVDSTTNFNRPLSGLKIIVDAGNGAGGFYANDVLAPLGADVSGSLYLDPNGLFPNHAPNPEDREALNDISNAVLATGADFGLIFDADVDRCAAIDMRGHEITRNGIVALASALIAESHPGTTVVTDSITSDQLAYFLTEKLKLKHHRFKRGYRNVINEALRFNDEGIDSQLAIETSGHAAFKENYFLDDGAYLATKIVIYAAKLAAGGETLDSLISELESPAEAIEIRLPIEAADFGAFADGVLEKLREYAETRPGMTIVKPNFEGLRISFDSTHGDGWCLLRKSLHEPLMPLNIESNAEGGCDKILQMIRPVLTNI